MLDIHQKKKGHEKKTDNKKKYKGQQSLKRSVRLYQ